MEFLRIINLQYATNSLIHGSKLKTRKYYVKDPRILSDDETGKRLRGSSDILQKKAVILLLV